MDLKIQFEKVQPTGDLKDDTLFYQRLRLLCKNDQGCCNSTTRTQATIVWYPEDTCITFKIAKICAKISTFHQKTIN